MRCGFVAIGVMAASIAISGQQPQPATVPLGDLARQAEAAKASVKKAKKTYTNADLSAVPRTEPTPAPAATPAAIAAKSADKPTTPDPKPAVANAGADAEKPKESEQAWRERAESLRRQMAEVQQRITALAANSPTEAAIKQANDQQLNVARQALEGLKQKWAKFEAGAVERKVPSAWLDPRPALQ